MRRSILLAIPFLLLAVRAPGAPQSVPADSAVAQQNVPRLGNFLGLSTILNFGRGAVRILAVISPSSPTATEGLKVIEKLLSDIPSKRLRVYVVLVHATAQDTQFRALDLASRHRDRRIVYLWDPAGLTASAMAPMTGAAASRAEDVYFLYDTDATFTTVPPEPVMWMHLNPRIDTNRMDVGVLGGKAGALVRAVEQKASDAALKGE